MLQHRHLGAGHVAAFADDLVAAGAVFGEQLHPFGEVVVGGVRFGDRRPRAERGDVGDERLDLAVVEERRLAFGLFAGVRERHPPGAQVEVGGERADPAQRGPGAFDAAGALLVGRRDALRPWLP